jgi:hypothetical protein
MDLRAAWPVLALALAGCFQPATSPATGLTADVHTTATATGTLTTTAPPGEDDIDVAGVVLPYAGGFLANLTAHNTGQHTFGYDTSYCVGGPWSATLSGPPGEALIYRDPGNQHLGCAGSRLGRLPPGAWLNWTAQPGCNLYAVCDNQWDGRLWTKGQAGRAPPGDYTWRIRFPYYDTPGHTENQTFTSPEGRHVKEVVFEVSLPP